MGINLMGINLMGINLMGINIFKDQQQLQLYLMGFINERVD